jgi:hypothetical protein
MSGILDPLEKVRQADGDTLKRDGDDTPADRAFDYELSATSGNKLKC